MQRYSLTTKVDFSCNLGRETISEIMTLSELGFTQDELDLSSDKNIESAIQEYFLEWQASYLDSGWTLVDEE